MNVYDALSAIPGKPSTEDLGLLPIRNVTDYGLFARVDGVFDYTHLDDAKLLALADAGGMFILDDEVMRNFLDNAAVAAERRRAVELIKARNPDCVVSVAGGNYERLKDVPVDFYAISHYLTQFPFVGFNAWTPPTDKPVYPYIWCCWADYGNINDRDKKLLLDPLLWREVCLWIKAHYPGCILWDSGAWREVSGGPWLQAKDKTQQWNNPRFQELWTMTREVFELVTIRDVTAHRQTAGGMEVTFRTGRKALLSKADTTKTTFEGLPVWWDDITANYGIGVKPPDEPVSEVTCCPTCGQPWTQEVSRGDL